MTAISPEIHDISIPATATTAVWPGDTPYHFSLAWDMSGGQTVNVGTITMSAHFGTHIDAPFHFDVSGARSGELDLTPFWGPAAVAEMILGDDGTIAWATFAALDFARTPRVLVKTGAWTDFTIFPTTIPVLSVETAARLASSGAILLGVDLPSVDPIDSHDLPVHHALDAGNVRILENLDLRAVALGNYELSALPLRLMDADGAPARAVLRKLSAHS